MRGVLHHFACFAALAAGCVLVASAPNNRAAWASAVYALALTFLFGASALYHRPTWAPRPRKWLRRLDHAAIFVLIAGSYTPVCLLALPGSVGKTLLALVWAGAAVGILQSLFWVNLPKPISAIVYVALGCSIGLQGKAAAAGLGPFGTALVAGGGIFYVTGALIYARRRPDPVPQIFGYHEIFHTLVILASICHFAAIFRLVHQ